MCNNRCAKKRKHALEEFISLWHHVFRYEVGKQANNGFIKEEITNKQKTIKILKTF